MVEEVVSVEAELRLDALGDGEVLRQRHVIVEGMRTAIGIDADIADLAASGQRERTGGRPRNGAGIGPSLGGSEVVGERGTLA